MKGNSFTGIRRVFWTGIFVVLALGGCEPSIVTPPPTLAPTTATVTETAPAATPTMSALPTSNIRVVTSVPKLPACPTHIPSQSIVHRDNNTGWRHYWASSSQLVFVNTLTIGGQWLWIATTKGVIRLNQHSLEYQLFPSTGTSPDIALDQVQTLAVDDQGRLWAGGEHGLARYTDGVGWKVIYTKEPVTEFGLDSDGNLWYFVRGARYYMVFAYRFQGEEPPGGDNWEPEQVKSDESYCNFCWYWSSSDDSNLDMFDWRFLVNREYEPNKKGKIDANGNKWSWQWVAGNLVIYHNDEGVQISFQGAVAVEQIGIWTGDRGGLFYHNGQTLKRYRFATDKAMVNHPRVYDLAFTADETGWATTSEGLFRFSEATAEWEMITKASVPMPFEDKYVGLVASGQQSSPWIYTPLYLLHFNGESWEQLSIPDNISGCWGHRRAVLGYQGDFWLNCGPWRRFDGQTWGFMESPWWIDAATDYNEKLYAIGDKGAVLIYDGTDWQQLPDYTEFSELNLSPGGALTVDATGRVWATYYYVTQKSSTWDYSYNYSIWRYSTDQGWCNILTLDPGPYVRSLLIDAYGNLWVLLSSDEVLRCNQENCEAWRFGDDQPFDAPITAMAVDSQGRIWIGGYGLLSVYDPAAERDFNEEVNR